MNFKNENLEKDLLIHPGSVSFPKKIPRALAIS